MKAASRYGLQKMLTAVGANCISATLLVAVIVPPARGYELSLVYAYPFYFWALPALGTACGVSIILLEAFAKEESHHWVTGLILVAASNSVLLLLPLFHGYASYPSGDALTHLGYVKDITDAGHVGPSNFYPIVHVLGATLIDVGGINSLVLPMVLYSSWSMMYFFSMYILSKVISQNRREMMVILAFASPMIFSNMHTVIHPSMLALFLMPLLLYAYHRRQILKTGRVESTIVLLLVAITITFTHPITAIFAILLLTTLVFSSTTLARAVQRRKFEMRVDGAGRISYTVPLIMSAVFFLWYFSYAAITKSVAKVFQLLVNPEANSIFERQTSLLALSGLTPFQTAELFVFRYGGITLYLVASTLATAWILTKFVKSRGRTGLTAFSYALAFLLALASFAYSLLSFTGEFDIVRISRFFLLISPIVCGLGFAGRQKRAPESERAGGTNTTDGSRLLALAGLVLVAIALIVAGLFSSPLNAEGNWQVSKMEVVGSHWFVEHQAAELKTYTITGNEYLKRFQDLTCGMDTCPPRMQVNFALGQVPSHFGYATNGRIAQTLHSESGYVVTDQVARVNPLAIPENVRPQVHQYTEADFARLQNDPSVSAVYSNGQFEVWILAGS